MNVKKAEDLFYKSVIPLSCRRHLHPDVEEFIIENAEQLNANSSFDIIIRLEEPSSKVEEIASMIRKHFENKRDNAKIRLKTSLKLGLRSLFTGFVFLVMMYLLTKLLAGILPENGLMIPLRELLIILAWVALWRPADLLLYEWHPYKRNVKLFERILNSKVRVIK